MEEYKLGHRDRVLYHGNVELSKNKKLQMCKRLWSQGFVFFHLLWFNEYPNQIEPNNPKLNNNKSLSIYKNYTFYNIYIDD